MWTIFIWNAYNNTFHDWKIKKIFIKNIAELWIFIVKNVFNFFCLLGYFIKIIKIYLENNVLIVISWFELNCVKGFHLKQVITLIIIWFKIPNLCTKKELPLRGRASMTSTQTAKWHKIWRRPVVFIVLKADFEFFLIKCRNYSHFLLLHGCLLKSVNKS